LLNHYFFKKEKAMTLVEVLITLGVIGVIAAITIPQIVGYQQELELKARWKKEYAAISSAVQELISENGGSAVNIRYLPNPIYTNCQTTSSVTIHRQCINALLSEVVSLGQVCNYTINSAGNICWHDPGEWKDRNGNTLNATCFGCAAQILNNGTMLYFNSNLDDTCTSGTTGDVCIRIDIDYNGKRGPNQINKDILSFYITKYGVRPAGDNANYTNAADYLLK